ncbi:MAG: hypothetical protein Kow0081_4100 [Candidatus Dojkabacteria bacterium]
MSSQAVIYRKYRPKSFAELYGQDHIKEILLNSLKNKNFSQAYLFSGPRGTGKTSTARLFAKAVNFKDFEKYNDIADENGFYPGVPEDNHSDIIEIDAASNRKIDDVRLIRENINFLPTELDYKVYIIDEAHMLTKEAFNALLKTLEEPPAHIIFILATTEPEKLPVTILSRLMRFDFGFVQRDQMIPKIKRILEAEAIEYNDESLTFIHNLSGGSFRDAESILNKIIQSSIRELTVESIQKSLGINADDNIKKIIKALLQGNYTSTESILTSLEKEGVPPSKLREMLIREISEIDVQDIHELKVVKLAQKLANKPFVTYSVVKLEIKLFCLNRFIQEQRSSLGVQGISEGFLGSKDCQLRGQGNGFDSNSQSVDRGDIDKVSDKAIRDKLVELAKKYDTRLGSIFSISRVQVVGNIANVFIKYKFNYNYTKDPKFVGILSKIANESGLGNIVIILDSVTSDSSDSRLFVSGAEPKPKGVNLGGQVFPNKGAKKNNYKKSEKIDLSDSHQSEKKSKVVDDKGREDNVGEFAARSFNKKKKGNQDTHSLDKSDIAIDTRQHPKDNSELVEDILA